MYVHVWDRRASDGRKPELLAVLDVLLLPGLNVCSDRFGGSFYRLGSHFQICQELELLATLSKRRLVSDGCEHAPNAGREIRLVNVELHVRRKLSAVACRAQIVGSVDLCPAHSREDRPGTHSFIFGRVTAGTGNGSMVTIRRIKSQQFRDGGRTRLMDGGANRHLHGF